MYDRYFGKVIWTNHALERLSARKLPQDIAFDAFQHPDKTVPGKNPGSTEYQKLIGPSLVTIIAKKNEKQQWIILSCWIDPPFPGTEDYRQKELYKKYRKSGFWGQLWYMVRKQIGF